MSFSLFFVRSFLPTRHEDASIDDFIDVLEEVGEIRRGSQRQT